MLNRIYLRYIWLINLLNSHNGMTFKEIDAAWQDEDNDLNRETDPQRRRYALRTFHNHKKAIKDLFGIEIVYYDDKWVISIPEEEDLAQPRREILSLITTNKAAEKLKGRILFEADPKTKTDWLQTVTRAMMNGRQLSFRYCKYDSTTGDRKPRVLAPYCIKMYKRRWYLIGKEIGDRRLKAFAMDDRMSELELSHKTFGMPRYFSAPEYFRDSIGIVVGKAQKIKVKVFGHEQEYWESAPLHPSQTRLVIDKAKDYSIYELNVVTQTPDGAPAWELYQELFSKMDRIEVLEPAEMRDEMAARLDRMRALYRKR